MSMAKIYIIGDSWGTPEGYAAWLEAQNHTHNILEDLGHTVVNCSIPGGSNIQSIDLALESINVHGRPDVLIWFHTESLRDLIPRPQSAFSIPQIIKKQVRLIYKHYDRMLWHMSNPIDIVIGSQAPVINKFLVRQPKLLIKDWRCKLLGIDSILSHTVCHTDMFEHPLCKDSAQDRLEWLKQNEKIVDMEKNSPLFPDDAHPGSRAHLELCKTHIIPLIEKYVDNA